MDTFSTSFGAFGGRNLDQSVIAPLSRHGTRESAQVFKFPCRKKVKTSRSFGRGDLKGESLCGIMVMQGVSETLSPSLHYPCQGW